MENRLVVPVCWGELETCRCAPTQRYPLVWIDDELWPRCHECVKPSRDRPARWASWARRLMDERTVEEQDAAPGAIGAGPRHPSHLLQTRLREAKRANISWHTILNNHASTRPKCHGGPLCPSVWVCKEFETCGSEHVCRLVLPNSYAPGDGLVVPPSTKQPMMFVSTSSRPCVPTRMVCLRCCFALHTGTCQ